MDDNGPVVTGRGFPRVGILLERLILDVGRRVMRGIQGFIDSTGIRGTERHSTRVGFPPDRSRVDIPLALEKRSGTPPQDAGTTSDRVWERSSLKI